MATSSLTKFAFVLLICRINMQELMNAEKDLIQHPLHAGRPHQVFARLVFWPDQEKAAVYQGIMVFWPDQEKAAVYQGIMVFWPDQEKAAVYEGIMHGGRR